MKKTTKILLVLAAVVAMTIGAVSTVMAADFPVIADWAETDDGWTAKDADGNAIKDTWAVNEAGQWFFLDKQGIMATESFIDFEGGLFYVDENGAMASGWNCFTNEDGDNSPIFDVIDVVNETDLLDGNKNNPYGEEVWVYLDPSKGAVTDAWFENNDGLYYYFEDIIMVAGDYAYEIDEKIYGFGPDGHMYDDWTEVFDTSADTKYDPLNDGKKNQIGWTYYKGGVMQKAGFEKINNEWYYFVSTEDSRFEGTMGADATVCLTSTYVEKDGVDFDAAFYFNEKGQLAKGKTTIGKASYGIENFLKAAKNNAPTQDDYKKLVLYFGEDGAQKEGLIDGNYYWITGSNEKYYTEYYIDKDEYVAKDKDINFVAGEAAKLPNAMVKDAIVKYSKDSTTYYMYFDADGNQVMNDLVEKYGLSFGVVGGKILTNNGETVKVGGRRYNFSNLNGILRLNGGEIAYGAETKSTDTYTLEVVAGDGVSDELIAEIAEELNGKYVVGETVSYTILKRKDIQFAGIVAEGDFFVDGTYKYAGSKTNANGENGHGYTFKFVVTELSKDEDVESDVITLTINAVPAYEVKVDDTVVGDYVAGETVTLTAKSGKIFLPKENDIYAVSSGAIDAAVNPAYKVSSGVTSRNTITFVMPANDLDVETEQRPAYTVTLKDCSKVKLKSNGGLYLAGEEVVLINEKANISEYTVAYANGDYVTVDANAFTMPAQNVTIKDAISTDTVLASNLEVAVTGATCSALVVKVGSTTKAVSGASIYALKAGDAVTITPVTGYRIAEVTSVRYENAVTEVVNLSYTFTNGKIKFTMPTDDAVTLTIVVTTANE